MMNTIRTVLTLIVVSVAMPCFAVQQAANTLTDQERHDGWRLLFDGEGFTGWHQYHGDPVGSAWTIEDGTITLVPGESQDWQTVSGGDIVTDEVFENFELSLEWKISQGGNSGIIYLVDESDGYSYGWESGLEMQVLDSDEHPDGSIWKHRAGDLYDLIEADTLATRSVGEWNHVRIVKSGPYVEHWMNGHRLLSVELWTDVWDALVARSKFSEFEGFGESRKGRISLQDHGDRVWYRNIKIRPTDNSLSQREKEEGWQLLFDGESVSGWHKFGGDPVGPAWRVVDGALGLIPQDTASWQTIGGGNIVTDEEFEDFELSLEWKIGPGGNSGIFYLVKENDRYDDPALTGLEMQVLDSGRHPDGRTPTHRAGELYDLIESKTPAERPVGEWNHARIIKRGPHVEHWMNGHLLMTFRLWTDEWDAVVATSKFADWEGFAEAKKGRIALQDHGDPVWYRNVKIRPL